MIYHRAAEYKGFSIRYFQVGAQWQAHYWQIGRSFNRYETPLCETPEEARRLARLVICKGGVCFNKPVPDHQLMAMIANEEIG